MSIFKSTLNTRPILKDSFKYVRSDMPTVVSESEKQWLVSNGITTVVDFRTDEERDKKPSPFVGDIRFSCYSIPIKGGDTVPCSPDEVSKAYINMVNRRFNEIIEFLLNTKTGVLYFCNAGKDRTGVVSAVLLHRLGYSDEYIIADYMKSKDNLLSVLTEYASQNPSLNIDVITPQRRYIEEFLKWYISCEKE